MNSLETATLERTSTQGRNTGPEASKRPRHDVIRTVRSTTQYRRDLKREGRADPEIEQEMCFVVDLLANRRPLPERLRDHRMWGKNRDCRDLHVRPDLVLIYLPTKTEITLVRVGSHSELFG